MRFSGGCVFVRVCFLLLRWTENRQQIPIQLIHAAILLNTSETISTIFLPDFGLWEASKACRCDQCPFTRKKKRKRKPLLAFSKAPLYLTLLSVGRKKIKTASYWWDDKSKGLQRNLGEVQKCKAYTRTDKCKLKRNTHVDAHMHQNPSEAETTCTFFHVFGKVNTDKKYARGKNERKWTRKNLFIFFLLRCPSQGIVEYLLHIKGISHSFFFSSWLFLPSNKEKRFETRRINRD